MRLGRDLLASFWFVEPELESYVEMIAWPWWGKLRMVRSGMAGRWQDAQIERRLGGFVGRFRWRNQKWSYWLHRRLGSYCDTTAC